MFFRPPFLSKFVKSFRWSSWHRDSLPLELSPVFYSPPTCLPHGKRVRVSLSVNLCLSLACLSLQRVFPATILTDPRRQ